MKISLADLSDTSPFVALWCNCFGDSPEVPRRFYSSVKSATLAAYEGEKLLGMANILPVYTDKLFGIYVYAACVDPDCRGKGVFRALMAQAEHAGIYKNCAFICLIPENEQVAETYRRHGYRIEVARYRTGASADGEEIYSLPDFSAFAMPDNLDADAYPVGLIKPLKAADFPEKLCFNGFMGEI